MTMTMTDNNYPITPPQLGQVLQWEHEYWSKVNGFLGSTAGCQCYIATQAALWGYEQRGAVNETELQKARDEELDACCELLDINGCPGKWIDMLLAARRPKPKSQAEEEPPSLKERIATAIARGNNSIALALLDQALPD